MSGHRDRQKMTYFEEFNVSMKYAHPLDRGYALQEVGRRHLWVGRAATAREEDVQALEDMSRGGAG